jgi:ABC-type lipoprotein release transport system permease subunit
LFRLVAGRSIALTALGTALGSVGAFAAAPLLGSRLFDTRPAEPSTHAAVAGVLLGLTLLAAIVPARRAMRVDPLTALRM